MSAEDDLVRFGIVMVVLIAIAGVPIMSFLTGRDIGRNEVEPQIIETVVVQECEPIYITATTTEKIDMPEDLPELYEECLTDVNVVAGQRNDALDVAEQLRDARAICSSELSTCQVDYTNILLTCKEANE